MPRLPSEEEVEAAIKALESYKLALGEVAHAWNHMQEQLGLLFCMVTGLDNAMGMGIWHALKSDRSQRDLLQAAIIAAAGDDEWDSDFPTAKDDIDWVLKKVNALANGRNSAIHAPMYSIASGEAEIRPLAFHGNPNAAKLIGKNLFAEFEWYEKYAICIRSFAAEMTLALMGRRHRNSVWMPWPERPLLPTVAQKSSRGGHGRPLELK